jgi:P27 family predicted phage terminase small subunit
MKGRKPKPIKLHELNGNPSKLSKEKFKREIRPDLTMPEIPWWLDYHARKEWERVCPELQRLGLLTNIDRTALAGYCMAYSRWLRAERELIKGFTYQYVDTDFQKKRANKPEVIIARDALNQVRAFCVEFGLTPSARARMSTPSGGKAEDELDKLLNTKRDN